MQFDVIAPLYAHLSRFVFGKAMFYSKTAFFHTIPDDAHILLVGGGSGESLQQLLQDKPNTSIDFVDSSKKMISLAQNRVEFSKKVNFYHCNIDKFNHSTYDVIITEFFFDLFQQREVAYLVSKIAPMLNPTGIWIDTDFRISKAWHHQILMQIMYFFFRITAGVKNTKLVDMNTAFKRGGLTITLKSGGTFFTSWMLKLSKVL